MNHVLIFVATFLLLLAGAVLVLMIGGATVGLTVPTIRAQIDYEKTMVIE